MSLVVGTNTSALYAQGALRSNQSKLTSTMERLSTGVRVNGAKDDAAGLAIGQNMTSQIRGLNQAVRNINDGVNLLQTADGGLSSITDMLQRMKELAVQSANGTYSNTQRAYLQKEAAVLQEQINKIIDTTTWNDKKLLDGSFAEQKIQAGANAGNTINLTININGSVLTPIAPSNITAYSVLEKPAGSPALGATNIPGDQSIFTYAIPTADGSYKVLAANVIAASTFTEGGFTPQRWAEIVSPNQPNGIWIQTSYINAFRGTYAGIGFNYRADLDIFYWESQATTNLLPFINLGTANTANTALSQIDSAIEKINSNRTTIGSYINRLNYAGDNVTSISSNLSASRSTIMDTDYATETTNLSKNQIVQQAATAMLAQANQQPQSVLALLKNL
jgi:flagellin